MFFDGNQKIRLKCCDLFICILLNMCAILCYLYICLFVYLCICLACVLYFVAFWDIVSGTALILYSFPISFIHSFIPQLLT